ncbi:MAG: OmpA family protein [Porticoccaceae bacterium]
MYKLLTTTTSAVLLAAAMSVGASEGVYLGGSGSGYFLDSERTIKGADESFVGSINLGHRTGQWAVEAGFGRDLAGDDLDVAKGDLIYYLGGVQPGWTPYLVGGVSYFDRDSSNLQRGESHTWQFGAGVGVSTMLSDHWEFRSDVRALQKIHNGRDNTTDAALTVGFNYYFNPPVAEVAAAEPAPAAAPQETPAQTRTITVRLNVEFEFDKAVVRNIYGDELAAIANAMKTHGDIDLVLEGHTDSVGTDAYNQGLSERRVAAVKAKIAQDYGIDPSRISTVGYGESRPIADNSTDEGRARNRRVVGQLSFTEVVDD